MSAATLSFVGIGSIQTRPNKSKVVALAGTAVTDAKKKKKKSPYEVLRVKQTATVEEIKVAYRALAKRYHPDVDRVGNSNGSEFVEIHEAYEFLTDPVAKGRYDFENVVSRVGSYPNAGRVVFGRWETDQCW